MWRYANEILNVTGYRIIVGARSRDVSARSGGKFGLATDLDIA
jgi:hypothetical protein